MDKWLHAALDYVPRWIDFQMRMSEQPGCVIAIAHRGQVVFERAFGYADLVSTEPLTVRHRFRIASHSKSFTAAGVLTLRDRGKLKLDDPIGRYVANLNEQIAKVTIVQLLSHSAGIVRDGADSGQFSDRRPFLDAVELIADLQVPPTIKPNTRFKYSNHGYGLIGLAIEAITGESYVSWIKREIVEAAGLAETEADMPIAGGIPFARGHSAKLPIGRRLRIPGDGPARAIAPAGGFVSTAHDLARFYYHLSPAAKKSILSVASRREIVRKRWRNPHSSLARFYGLGTVSGTLAGWSWFGHSGGVQGYISRTVSLPEHLTVSVLTNAIDGPAIAWVDGAIHILHDFAQHGAPSRKVIDWTGRWWSLWRTFDVVTLGRKVLIANPALPNPFMDTVELHITGRDEGRIALAGGYESHGEKVRRIRNRSGEVVEFWLGGAKLLSEDMLASEIRARYER